MIKGPLHRFISLFKPGPDPQAIAQQLRRPAGEAAVEVGQKMDLVNEAQYDLTLEAMPLQAGDRILEIGFGTGKYFKKIPMESLQLQVCGIDFSDAMVAMAKKYNRELIRSGRLELKWGSSEDIPFPGRSFDKVFCNMVIYFWDHPGQHLEEIRRVLKPGGILYTGFRTPDSMRAFPFVKYGFNLYEIEQWHEMLSANGFSVIDTKTKTDPEFELRGKTLALESCCVAARREDANR